MQRIFQSQSVHMPFLCRIIALTATPGSDTRGIQNVIIKLD